MLRNILHCFLLFLLTPVLLYTQGASVSIQLTNNTIVSGELLSVRSSAVVISTIEGLSESELPENRSSIVSIQNEQIISLTVKGESRVFSRSGAGLLIGAAGGMMLGLMSGDDSPRMNGGYVQTRLFSYTAFEKGSMLAILFGGIGMIVGIIVGVVDTAPDRAIEPLPVDGFISIKSKARYPVTEPNFIISFP